MNSYCSKLYKFRFAEERSNELAKVNAEKEETIAKLKSQQISVKPIQDFPTAEPTSKFSKFMAI